MVDLAPLPDPVRLQEIRVIRSPWGYEPRTSCVDGDGYNDLASAVEAALAAYDKAHSDQQTVWLRAGTGAGAAVLDIQGILLLKAALAGRANPT